MRESRDVAISRPAVGRWQITGGRRKFDGVGAGDMAQCGSPGATLTAPLLETLPGTVFAAGDNAYPTGSADDYRNWLQLGLQPAEADEN